MLKTIFANVKTSFATLVLGALCACGVQSSQQYDESQVEIVGGTEVSQTDAVAASTVLFVDPAGNIGCSGVVIGPRQIFSAGHCFGDVHWRNVHVLFATQKNLALYSGANKNVRYVTKVVRHTGYKEDFSGTTMPPFDVSIATLDEDIPTSHKAATIVPDAVVLKKGDEVVIAGFGKTSDSENNVGTLRKVSTVIGKFHTQDKEVEFGPTPGAGACGGDSGGPAFVTFDGQLFLLGIASRGVTDSCMDGNAVYSDMRFFKDWISLQSK